MAQAHPDDDRKSMKTTKKTKAKTELSLFALPDESTEAETLAMGEEELIAMS